MYVIYIVVPLTTGDQTIYFFSGRNDVLIDSKMSIVTLSISKFIHISSMCIHGLVEVHVSVWYLGLLLSIQVQIKWYFLDQFEFASELTILNFDEKLL